MLPCLSPHPIHSQSLLFRLFPDEYFLHESSLVHLHIHIESRRVLVSRRAAIETSVILVELIDDEKCTVIHRLVVIVGEIELLVVLGPDDGRHGVSDGRAAHLHPIALRRVQLVRSGVLPDSPVCDDQVHRFIRVEERRTVDLEGSEDHLVRAVLHDFDHAHVLAHVVDDVLLGLERCPVCDVVDLGLEKSVIGVIVADEEGAIDWQSDLVQHSLAPERRIGFGCQWFLVGRDGRSEPIVHSEVAHRNGLADRLVFGRGGQQRCCEKDNEIHGEISPWR
ncbi:hypothetical protein PMAYCL1PPCAC_14457, partial [Pristionchus mayeri]